MSAPEARRIEVKLAASIAVSRSATRQSSELPAKASIANVVTTIRRGMDRRVMCAPSYHVAAGLAAR